MKTLNISHKNINLELVKEFGKIVGNLSKASAEAQLKMGAALVKARYHHELCDINKSLTFCKLHGLEIHEYAFEIVQICKAIQAMETQQEQGYLVKLDTKQSGILLISLLTRDKESLRVLGVLNNTNSDLYQIFADEFGSDRATMKKPIIGYNYNGNKKIEELLGKAGAEKFRKLFSKILPKVDLYREIMLKAWRADVDHWKWTLPDGLEVFMPIFQPVPTKGKRAFYKENNMHVDWVTSAGIAKSASVYFPKLQGHEFGIGHCRGLNANLTHSMDAFVLRENVRICTQAERYRSIFDSLGKPGMLACSDASDVERMYNIFKTTGIASARAFEFLQAGDSIPTEWYNALKDIVANMPHKSFDVVTVHDEFMCHVNYVNDMRRVFNHILKRIYEGHMLDYIKTTFRWGESQVDEWGDEVEMELPELQLDEVDPEISQAITNNVYLLQ